MEILMDYVITSWDPLTICRNPNQLHTLAVDPRLQILMAYISRLCSRITKLGFLMAYLSRLRSLAKLSLTNLSLPNLT